MTIETFDDFDDFLEAEERAKKKADDNTHDWQQELDKGDYFIKDSGLGFPIFGQVLKRHRPKHLQNYRLCECYSIGCPYGERGDVHVSTIGKKLTEDEFKGYQGKGWKI